MSYTSLPATTNWNRMSATSEPLHGQSLQASVTVKDLDKSVAWYVDVVGFTLARRIERGGKLRGVAVQAGEVRIILNQDDGATLDPAGGMTRDTEGAKSLLYRPGRNRTCNPRFWRRASQVP
jgi:catechol 2,3-dioxygenase-like lactoylglutathione lyase family enzyme